MLSARYEPLCWHGICTAAEHIAEPAGRRRVVCYPVQLATPAPLPSAVIERKEQGEMTVLTYRGDTQRLNTPYFHKLVSANSDCFLSVTFYNVYVSFCVVAELTLAATSSCVFSSVLWPFHMFDLVCWSVYCVHVICRNSFIIWIATMILGLSNSYCEFGAFCDDIRCIIVCVVLIHICLKFCLDYIIVVVTHVCKAHTCICECANVRLCVSWKINVVDWQYLSCNYCFYI